MSIVTTEPRRQSHLPGTCIILMLNLLSFTKHSFCTEPRRHARDIATSNRAIFTSPTATRTLASAQSSFGSVTSSQSSDHSIDRSQDRQEEEEEQDVDRNCFRPTATRTLASAQSSFGSVTSSQSSGHKISRSHDRRDEQEEEEEQDVDQNCFRENDEQEDNIYHASSSSKKIQRLNPSPVKENTEEEDNNYHASSSSKRNQRPNPPPVITKKYRATDAEKLTAAWNHSKGLAQAQQHLPASRLGSKHS
jgi:hypothetical protein